ncbi:hypothetical protein PT974_00977 [Cladobotryum mycophilum]|uniref:Uncharacterized protein n=1 Tax=Cladobotryum mycophilum TaxID=491253 RepID=A0ABR0T3S8_9HYPO
MPDDIDSLVKGAPTAPYNVKLGTAAVLSSAGKALPVHDLPEPVDTRSIPAGPVSRIARQETAPYFLSDPALPLGRILRLQTILCDARRRPRCGGSIYWAVEGAQKVCFMGGIITAVLVWATGIWDRGIRWPRRWFAISNRGLRGFNCKLVIIRQTWWSEALSTIGFFLTYGIFSHTASSSYRHVEPALLRQVEKELQLTSDNHPTLIVPSDDDERENWELYRTEYWERENERRALLRQKVQEHGRKLAKEQYGWLWWLPWYQTPQPPRRHHELNKAPHSRLASSERERKRRSSSVRRSSVSSSRSQTPMFDADFIGRRTSAASDKLRKKPSGSKSRRSGTESRSATPSLEVPSKLSMESNAAVDTESEGSVRTLRSGSVRASKERFLSVD